MDVLVCQPPYPESGTAAAAEDCLAWMLRHLNALKPKANDLILLPEYANAPGITEPGLLRRFSERQGGDFIRAVASAARRLGSAIAFGSAQANGSGWVNRSVLLDLDGTPVFHYDKIHLTDAETRDLSLTPGTATPVAEYRGVRIAFAVCFDLYFPEYFSTLASRNVDLILCPSYQRSEAARRICLLAQTRAFDSGAYILRSGYAMGRPEFGGQSLVAAPDGTILWNAGPMAGVITGRIEPDRKFVKPASHGEPDTEHRGLIERHRRPVVYRPFCEMRRRLSEAPFPKLCAHRGMSQACPENTLPAFAAAVAAGAHEIELDVWLSRDGVPVVCHDDRLDRTTSGNGRISDLDWPDIRRLDAGIKHGEHWLGVGVPRLEEVLEFLGGRAGLNIHLKEPGPDGQMVRMVCDLMRSECLVETSYIAGDREGVLELARRYAPDVPRACLAHQDDAERLIATARKYACQRVQFCRSVTPNQIRQAHEAGLVCNLFWSDDASDAMAYVRKGIDVILTNQAQQLVAHGFPSLHSQCRRAPPPE